MLCVFERLSFKKHINYFKLGVNEHVNIKTFPWLFQNFLSFFRDFSRPANDHLKIPWLFQVFHDRTNPAICMHLPFFYFLSGMFFWEHSVLLKCVYYVRASKTILTSRRSAWGILRACISPPAPGLPIALWSTSGSASGAPPAAGTGRRSLDVMQLKKTLWGNTKSGWLEIQKKKKEEALYPSLTFKSHTHSHILETHTRCG